MKQSFNSNNDYCSHVNLNIVENVSNKNIVNSYLFKTSENCCCGLKPQKGSFHVIKFKSNFNEIKPVIDTILKDLTTNHSLPEENKVDLFIILSELFVNAVEHGNKNSEEKEIVVNYFVVNKIINLSVEDQGNGFDYKNCIDTKKSPGLSLIKSLASKIYWNITGNKVYIDIDFN